MAHPVNKLLVELERRLLRVSWFEKSLSIHSSPPILLLIMTCWVRICFINLTRPHLKNILKITKKLCLNISFCYLKNLNNKLNIL